MTLAPTRPILRLALAGSALVLAACSVTAPYSGATVQAHLEPTQGNRAAGTVTFVSDGPKTTVHARVTGLTPSREHGFHIHENGNCASPDAMSAGGHFNPDGKPHGPQHGERHAGDMPALRADASGAAEMRFVMEGVALGSGARNIVGRSVIVHAQPDDYKTQPTGNSGARLACGVIR